MRLFATSTSRPAQAPDGSSAAGRGRELSERLRAGLPARFEALGEALAARLDVQAVCSVTGRELARDGADMATALEGLRTTYAVVARREPDFAAVQALCLAWSDETLAYLHQLSCEDPLTGLASLAHLRARLSEIYRGVEHGEASVTISDPAGQVTGLAGWALVVIDLPWRDTEDQFAHALRLVRTAETVRLVFLGGETISEITANRLALLTRRDDLLGRRVAALRSLLDVDGEGSAVRVWIEGLPEGDAAAGALLDELART